MTHREAEFEDLRRKLRRRKLLQTRQVSADQQTARHTIDFLGARHFSESSAGVGVVGGSSSSNKPAGVRSRSTASSSFKVGTAGLAQSPSLQQLLLSPNDSASSPLTSPASQQPQFVTSTDP